jgi:hypothetical protein
VRFYIFYASGLYFRGERIWQLAMEDLMAHGTRSANQVVILELHILVSIISEKPFYSPDALYCTRPFLLGANPEAPKGFEVSIVFNKAHTHIVFFFNVVR